MSTVAPTAEVADRPVWIISRGWDLAYLVATPVAIVPLVLIALSTKLTPEQLSLAVISFASLGHHLPGFMRAYGDRELFARFRWRFLMAPPLLLAVALLFSPPDWLAQSLGLPWQQLHGLQLILLIWGTWHGLMQTYGFMRIYDARMGETSPREARLDHALCLTMFVGGVVFSDSRMFGIAGAMWQAGLPRFGPEALVSLRWAVGIVGGLVLAAYLANLISRRRAGQRLNLVKLLLAVSTGLFFWYTGRLSTNLLIGLAMFEIYHAVQYFAIVWIYNRRLFTRAGERFGWLGFLFRDRVSMLCVYLGLIGAYSSIRYLTGDASHYIYTADGNNAYQWLFALFVTSSLLHFYFDGFIWKVSEPETQVNLVEGVEGKQAPSALQRSVPALIHLTKWAVFVGLAGWLLLSERQLLGEESPAHQQRYLKALGELTPELPEAMILRSREALERGDRQQAAALAMQAIKARPRSTTLHRDAAMLLIAADADRQAQPVLEALIDRNEQEWQGKIELALIYQRSRKLDRASELLKEVISQQPELTEPRLYLAHILRKQGQPQAELEQMQAVVRLQPSDYAIALAHADALKTNQQWRAAILEYQRAASLKRLRAEPQYKIATVMLLENPDDQSRAITPLRKAVQLDSTHYPAHWLLGQCYYALEKWTPAVDLLQRSLALKPEHSQSYVDLASAQLHLGQQREAIATLQLGLERAEDRELIEQALELARSIPFSP